MGPREQGRMRGGVSLSPFLSAAFPYPRVPVSWYPGIPDSPTGPGFLLNLFSFRIRTVVTLSRSPTASPPLARWTVDCGWERLGLVGHQVAW